MTLDLLHRCWGTASRHESRRCQQKCCDNPKRAHASQMRSEYLDDGLKRRYSFLGTLSVDAGHREKLSGSYEKHR